MTLNLAAKTAEFKQKLDNGAILDDLLVEAFAVVREAGKRSSTCVISMCR